MHISRPGERVDTGPLTTQLDFSTFNLKISTDRYYSREYLEREREMLWMRVWQIVGRADEIPEAGDWMEYRLFDQSYLIVRGRDNKVRGFVNACRHRGNQLCKGKGRATRFTCAYHKWSYGLDGKLLAVANPYFGGTVENFVGAKEELGLMPVSLEVFAGFVFLNPDPNAPSLDEFLGEAKGMLAAYCMDDMVPVTLNKREPIKCNWKVVMDAFQEGYHVQAVHPELISLADLTYERYSKIGYHGATTVPFLATDRPDASPEEEVAMIKSVPIPNFPGLAEVMPRFDELVATYRGADGKLTFPKGVKARTLLQRATRENWTRKGLDVSALTDNQMSDYQFWSLFPNVFFQLGVGDITFIQAVPHPEDPNRCVWRVTQYMWAPPEQREAKRIPLTDVPEGQHEPYFLALEQDFEQMEAQQNGLRNKALKYMVLTKQEPRVAHLHAVLDRWMEGKAG